MLTSEAKNMSLSNLLDNLFVDTEQAKTEFVENSLNKVNKWLTLDTNLSTPEKTLSHNRFSSPSEQNDMTPNTMKSATFLVDMDKNFLKAQTKNRALAADKKPVKRTLFQTA